MNLVELSVSLLLASLIGLAATGFGRAALSLLRVDEASREARQLGVAALDMFMREWRIAGFSANGQKIAGVTGPRMDGVELKADLDGDGAFSSRNERIAYKWDGTRSAVMRSTQDSSPQPWIDQVPPEGFRLVYFDAGGRELADPGMDSERIAGVGVVLRVRWQPSAGETEPNGVVELLTFIARRNP
jgi:hypothetical protein